MVNCDWIWENSMYAQKLKSILLLNTIAILKHCPDTITRSAFTDSFLLTLSGHERLKQTP